MGTFSASLSINTCQSILYILLQLSLLPIHIFACFVTRFSLFQRRKRRQPWKDRSFPLRSRMFPGNHHSTHGWQNGRGSLNRLSTALWKILPTGKTSTSCPRASKKSLVYPPHLFHHRLTHCCSLLSRIGAKLWEWRVFKFIFSSTIAFLWELFIPY